jgi:hypothetical protein
MTTLSIRGLDDQALAGLKARAAREKASVNSVVLNLIDEGLGRKPAATRHRHNDLDALAGTWSDEDLSTFSEATAGFEAVDPALWK